MKTSLKFMAVAAGVLMLMIALPPRAAAHCDTMNGPVVTAARKALETGDVTHVLAWVRAEDEPGVREAFSRTLQVRKAGGAARELADMYFFETVVRVHRMGEGIPYTGLKPAESEVEPGIAAADTALATGDIDRLSDETSRHIHASLREKFSRVTELKKHAGENVEAGRAYVAAYVDFIHYVERLHQAASPIPEHGAAPAHAHE